MAYTKGKTGRTEHNGPKRCRGFWGRKAEAKKVSKKIRRAASKALCRKGS